MSDNIFDEVIEGALTPEAKIRLIIREWVGIEVNIGVIEFE